jgi:hypothetical protein
MRENIPTLIAMCNNQILSWYRKYLPENISEFTPVNNRDETIINMIYDMFLILRKKQKIQLYTIIRYYFAIVVVEYYVLNNRCPVFRGQRDAFTELSVDMDISCVRRRMLGFMLP